MPKASFRPAQSVGAIVLLATGLLLWYAHTDALSAQTCTYNLRPVPAVVATGGTITAQMLAPAGCAWTVTRENSFITIDAGESGSGDGTITITFAENPGTQRVAQIRGPGVSLSLAQLGCLSLTDDSLIDREVGIVPLIRSHAGVNSGRIRFRAALGAACDTSVAPTINWATFNVGDFSTGLGFVTYAMQPNLSGDSRSAQVLIGGFRVNLFQSGAGHGGINFDAWPDLVWQHQGTGHIAAWTMRGLLQINGDYLNPQRVDPAWKIAGVGDMTGDGHLDLLWQRDDGLVGVWIMRSGTLVSGDAMLRQMQNADWRVGSFGDMNGDGRLDIVWRHRTTGDIAVWLMRTASPVGPTGTVTLARPRGADWQLVGAADFTFDGQTDLLWQNDTSGAIEVSQLSWAADFSWTEGATLPLGQGPVEDTNWKIRAVTDLNLDGRPDLVWQHRSSGHLAGWLMSGVHHLSGSFLTPAQVPDTDWVIRGPK